MTFQLGDDEKPSHPVAKNERAVYPTQDDFLKVCGFKEIFHHIFRLFLSASSEPLDKLLSSLIRFLRLLVRPQLSVLPQLFLHHPSHLHAVLNSHGLSLQADQELSLQVAELTRAQFLSPPTIQF
ncbi:hypothetical protein TNCV_1368961 [Trichonephila clavipes]|nr:hypothetical protein TNCV_1368961 [Trichonephila clavipes]